MYYGWKKKSKFNFQTPILKNVIYIIININRENILEASH